MVLVIAESLYFRQNSYYVIEIFVTYTAASLSYIAFRDACSPIMC